MTSDHTQLFGLNSDYQLLRDQVIHFCKKEIMPRARQIDIDNTFARDLWPKLGQLGALGVTVSDQYGGAGLGYLAQSIIMEELSRASAAVALSYGAHANLCVNQLF